MNAPALVVLVAFAETGTAETARIDQILGDLADLAEGATVIFETRGHAFAERQPESDEALGFSAVAKAEIAGPLLDALELSLTPVYRAGAPDYLVGDDVSLSERGAKRPRAGIDDAWIAWRNGPFAAKVGKQIVNWGATELYAPSNDLTPTDRLDPPFAFALGQPAVLLSYDVREFGVEFVAVPLFTPDRLPRFDNPWSRGADSIADALEARTGVRPEVRYGRQTLPDGRDGVQIGGRIVTSALIDNTDLFASIFDGVRKTPNFTPRQVSPSVLELDATYPSYREVAVGFSTVADAFVLNAEAALHVADKADEDEDYLAFVVGARRDWSDLGLQSVSRLSVTLEYAGEVVTREVSAGQLVLPSAFDRTAANSLLGRAELEFDADTRLIKNAAINLDDGDYAFDALLERHLNDRLVISGGFQIFAGPRDSFFGGWGDNDRGYVALSVFY